MYYSDLNLLLLLSNNLLIHLLIKLTTDELPHTGVVGASKREAVGVAAGVVVADPVQTSVCVS